MVVQSRSSKSLLLVFMHVFHIFENHLLVVEFVSGVVGGCLATVCHVTVWGKLEALYQLYSHYYPYGFY